MSVDELFEEFTDEVRWYVAEDNQSHVHFTEEVNKLKQKVNDLVTSYQNGGNNG